MHGRPGRERGGGRCRRRHRRRHEDREPQPPVGHRAVPGGGDGGRRDPPRHLHDGRPADRVDGPAAVRPAGGRAEPLDRRRARSRASPATATRSACPTVGGEVDFDPTYQGNPLVNVLCLGVLPVERLVLGQATGAGNLAVLLGSTTGRDGIGGGQRPGVGWLRGCGEGRGQAAERAGRRSVRGEAAHRGLPRACSTPGWRSGCRTSAVPACAALRARRRAAAAWGWTSTSTPSRCASPGSSPSRS